MVIITLTTRVIDVPSLATSIIVQKNTSQPKLALNAAQISYLATIQTLKRTKYGIVVQSGEWKC
jgi:hypothetical protein